MHKLCILFLTTSLCTFFRMHRLGTSTSHPREWGATTAYYSRLTIATNSRINRDVNSYPPLPGRGFLPAPVNPHHILRTECLDLGHTRTYFELCK